MERSGDKPAVLLVEDDADCRHLHQRILQDRYEVLIASDSETARAHVHARREGVAAVLMDISLKGSRENGFSLVRYLRTQPGWERTPIVAVTAHATREDRHQALGAGCDAFVSKPFAAAELRSVLEQLIAARQPENPKATFSTRPPR
jgi:two-component system cell cycle response regulator DivK